MIRHATLEDIAAITQLQQEFLSEHERLYDPLFYKLAPNAAQEFGNWLHKKVEQKTAGVFVAESQDEQATCGLVGYVTGWIEERPPLYELRKIGYLSNIYVKPEYRNKGLARALNTALLDWFKGKDVAYIELSVDSRAQSSVDAWERLGYTEIGKRMRRTL